MAKRKNNPEEVEQEIPVRVRIVEKKKKNGRVMAEHWREMVREDRFWAALAQALSPLMIAMILFGDGLGWLGAIFVTAGIYLYFNSRSAFVAAHARQALAMQILGTFGWIALMLAGTAAWIVLLLISIILIVVLVGIILTPLVALAYPLFLLASFGLPLSTALFGGLGALEAWRGSAYRYPYLADWLDEKLGAPAQSLAVTDVRYV